MAKIFVTFKITKILQIYCVLLKAIAKNKDFVSQMTIVGKKFVKLNFVLANVKKGFMEIYAKLIKSFINR